MERDRVEDRIHLQVATRNSATLVVAFIFFPDRLTSVEEEGSSWGESSEHSGEGETKDGSPEETP